MDWTAILAAAGALAVAGLLYTYCIFPLLTIALAARARKRRAEWARGQRHSIILVVRNEGRRIRRRIRNLLAQRSTPDLVELIVVDDHSTDDTRAVVAMLARRDPRIRLIEATGHGKASGINDGVRAARGGILVFCDARQVFEHDAVGLLLGPFKDPKVRLVAGNLQLLPKRRQRAQGGFAGLYWTLERRLRRAEARLGMIHGVAGAIYAVRREAMPVLPPDLILDDMFVPLEVGQRGGFIQYVDAAVAWDAQRGDSQEEYVKRRRTLAGNFQLLALRPSLLAFYRNRQLFAFFSHKVLRLATPLFIITLLLALAALGPPWLTAIVICGMVVALLALWLPLGNGEPSWLGSLMRLARDIVLINVAILSGFWHVLTGRSRTVWVPNQPQTR